jgi:hypothetical protein
MICADDRGDSFDLLVNRLHPSFVAGTLRRDEFLCPGLTMPKVLNHRAVAHRGKRFESKIDPDFTIADRPILCDFNMQTYPPMTERIFYKRSAFDRIW